MPSLCVSGCVCVCVFSMVLICSTLRLDMNQSIFWFTFEMYSMMSIICTSSQRRQTVEKSVNLVWGFSLFVTKNRQLNQVCSRMIHHYKLHPTTWTEEVWFWREAELWPEMYMESAWTHKQSRITSVPWRRLQTQLFLISCYVWVQSKCDSLNWLSHSGLIRTNRSRSKTWAQRPCWFRRIASKCVITAFVHTELHYISPMYLMHWAQQRTQFKS